MFWKIASQVFGAMNIHDQPLLLSPWLANDTGAITEFEKQMDRKTYYLNRTSRVGKTVVKIPHDFINSYLITPGLMLGPLAPVFPANTAPASHT